MSADSDIRLTRRETSLSIDRRTSLLWLGRIALFAGLLVGWEAYGSRPDIFSIAPFSKVVQAFWQGIASGEYAVAVGGTLQSVAIGYVIAAVLGVGIGTWIGVSRYAQNTIEPLTSAMYATPVSLFIPVIAVFTGLEMQGRVLLIVLWCVFEITVTTSAGVRQVPAELIDVARSFDAPRSFLYRKVIIPAAMPHVVLGLRLGVARAMRGAVTAELLLAAANLGLIVLTAGARFRVPELLAGILLTMLLGLALMSAAMFVEKRILAYHEHR